MVIKGYETPLGLETIDSWEVELFGKKVIFQVR